MITNRLGKSKVSGPKRSPQQICEDGNASIARMDPPRRDIEWIVRDNKAMLVWRKTSLAMLQDTARNRTDVMDRRGQPMSESDTYALNLKLEQLGATKRYHRDGTKYDAPVDRSPEGQDGATRLDRNDESAVPQAGAQTS
jgi:hypothetical protein